MSPFRALLSEETLTHISNADAVWLESVFARFGGRFPTLEEMWLLMDEVWIAHGCDPEVTDDRITTFYAHPVWLLNGLFIEQHEQSLDNRRQFSEWVVKHNPQRVADFGGGFGGLARMIGAACPVASVEIIEPHPHAAGVALSMRTRNVRYRAALAGEYDVLVATDVFEHVPDPLALASSIAVHLREDGGFLVANCFWPVIRCHLPQTFHFRFSWDRALSALGLMPDERVCYGRSYIRKEGSLNLDAARRIEARSRAFFPWFERLPCRMRRYAAKFVFP